MGAGSFGCTSKKNYNAIHHIDESPSKTIIQPETPLDLHQTIPHLFNMSQNEFKRIYKQSKKSKYTKRLLSKMNSDIHENQYNHAEETKLDLIDVTPDKLTDSFIIKSKSLINAASILSLVIVKDIIFQIQILRHNRYMYQYNHYYHQLQLKQRYVDLEELIMIHHGSITSLYTTIIILLHIGYETEHHPDTHNTKLLLPYRDLSYLDEIKFHISLKEKLELNAYHYDQYKFEDKRYILYETLSVDIKQALIHNESVEHDAVTVDDVYLLVSGYLERIPTTYRVINDIIELCIKFYLIPNDTDYSNMLSFSERDYPYAHAMKLDVFNFSTLDKYSLNIEGLNSEGTHYMHLVRNISLPQWIKQDIVDLGGERSIYDERYFRVMNSKHLCVMYDQITYQHYSDTNHSDTNKQVMIVFDIFNPEYGAYNIEFAKSFALNLYLWKADRKIFHRKRNSIICLNRIGNTSSLCEYDIDNNKYITFKDGELEIDRTEGAGMCLFDNESKLLLCGGHTSDTSRCTLKSSEIYCIPNDYDGEYESSLSVSLMNLARMNHGMLYEKELQQIIVGGGQDKDIFNGINLWNRKEIDSYRNKYRYLTPHTVEILDLNKNVWKLIECKTKNGYASNPYLWYNNSNPFIINIFNSYLSYSGKRANHSEFLDLREQKKWIQNYDINQYLKENETCHISMF